MTQNALVQLKNLTTVVADSSDLEAIEKFRPLDATTNPSLITAAAEQPESKELIEDAYYQAKEEGYQSDALIERTIDILTVQFGVEILKLIGKADVLLGCGHIGIEESKRLIPVAKRYGVMKIVYNHQ